MSDAPSELDAFLDFDDEPLEGVALAGSEREGPPPDPFMRRFTTILVAGLVMVGLAVVVRIVLDAAAPIPAGVVEHRISPTAAGEGATIARYEWERERIAR